MELSEVPEEAEFSMGDQYLRKELHNQFGGQRQYGISTPKDHSFILVFTDTESEEHGYRDHFRDDGIFIYSGEGRVGDMTMDGGNERIRDHHENNDSLHVFELVAEQNGADVHSYVGEYEHIGHYWEEDYDDNDDLRDVIRFKLAPVGGPDLEIEESEARDLSEEELFERAKQATSSAQTTSSSSTETERRNYTRSNVVKEFALRTADGVCQGCKEKAPFKGKDGNWFLEVHHLHRRSDGGPDDPENVIALCPNCHRRRHHGKDGDEFNEKLVKRVEDRNKELLNN
ncbi:HNH endonuclease signature motif containing protein [Natronomonas gomsonensis]|uniref:HNH endonuclease n=1 Tax=Natronomonas gomsonensis TaxID=1046043 RepID=UPI0015BEEE34|nr:HNH endonuclease signature motif containing protein [Natronomonas gomsonensis]